jgi:gamma-carbonic anhydrase
MRIEHAGHGSKVDPTAYVSPAAVLSGDVLVGADSRVLHGAVLTSEGEPLGADGSLHAGSRPPPG